MMAGSVSSLEGGYVAPWYHFASFSLRVPITVTSASAVCVCLEEMCRTVYCVMCVLYASYFLYLYL